MLVILGCSLIGGYAFWDEVGHIGEYGKELVLIIVELYD